MRVTLEQIRRAARLIADHIENTTCAHSRTLSKITGAEIFLKFENLQFTASFKERGALAKLLSLTAEQRARGVIAMSAGNHAQAVAYHAQRLGIPAVIVMPRYTPNVKVEHTRAFGAEIILHGEGLDEAESCARKLMAERDLELVHPYDDEKVIAGQGTIALEVLAEFPDLDVLVVPIGGGGLISGNAVAAKGIRGDIRVVGVQAARFPSMRCALDGTPGQCGTSTMAEGIAVTRPGTLTLPVVRELVDDILLVDEFEIERGVLLLLEVEKTVVEGAGAVGLAAVCAQREYFAGRRVGLVLSGGNIDLLALSSVIQRGLVRSGRLVRLCVDVQDNPGALGRVADLLGRMDANIIEVSHQRAFTKLPLRSAEIEFVLETRGREHVVDIVTRLTRDGYAIRSYSGDRTLS
ncbi:threonine ammonia-lyase [Thermodesulfobacteriota bacterium]